MILIKNMSSNKKRKKRCYSDCDSLFNLSYSEGIKLGPILFSEPYGKNSGNRVVCWSRFKDYVNWPNDADAGGLEGLNICEVFKL